MEYLKLSRNHKVIFLDIDGVLNSGWSTDYFRDGEGDNLETPLLYAPISNVFGDYVDIRKTVILFDIVNKTPEARIVFTSSCYKSRKKSIECKEHFEIMLSHVKDSRCAIILSSFLDNWENNVSGSSVYTGGGIIRGEAILKTVERCKLIHWFVIDDDTSVFYPIFAYYHGFKNRICFSDTSRNFKLLVNNIPNCIHTHGRYGIDEKDFDKLCTWLKQD